MFTTSIFFATVLARSPFSGMDRLLEREEQLMEALKHHQAQPEPPQLSMPQPQHPSWPEEQQLPQLEAQPAVGEDQLRELREQLDLVASSDQGEDPFLAFGLILLAIAATAGVGGGIMGGIAGGLAPKVTRRMEPEYIVDQFRRAGMPVDALKAEAIVEETQMLMNGQITETEFLRDVQAMDGGEFVWETWMIVMAIAVGVTATAGSTTAAFFAGNAAKRRMEDYPELAAMLEREELAAILEGDGGELAFETIMLLIAIGAGMSVIGGAAATGIGAAVGAGTGAATGAIKDAATKGRRMAVEPTPFERLVDGDMEFPW